MPPAPTIPNNESHLLVVTSLCSSFLLKSKHALQLPVGSPGTLILGEANCQVKSLITPRPLCFENTQVATWRDWVDKEMPASPLLFQESQLMFQTCDYWSHLEHLAQLSIHVTPGAIWLQSPERIQNHPAELGRPTGPWERIINCFNLLCFGAVCYTAIESLNPLYWERERERHTRWLTATV